MMFLQTDFNTEDSCLKGVEHTIKDACLRILQLCYDLPNGLNITLGVFSGPKTKLPILNFNFNINPNDEIYKKQFSAEALNGKTFIEAMYGYLQNMPCFKNSKFVKDA